MAEIGNLGSLRVGVELPIKDWNKNYGKITDDVKQYPKKTEKALGRAGKAWEKHAGAIKKASLGMVAFGTATVAALGFAVSAAGDFQQSMVNTQSVVGATSEELQALTGFAREMGKQTVFSAKESADAMYSLGSAGLSTKEIMDSLKGTLNLAAATQSELAFTSKAVASTLSQYGLDASEATRISNVFTATISASQATMDKLATSMSLVGPVARSIGMSLEETTGILGSLFNAGLDASTAGTSLRQSIAQLLKPTDDAKEALSRLGVETLDSGGNLRDLTDIIRDLETSGLSAADALTIFGVRAGPGMLALVSKGADAIEDLTEKVTGTNKAAEIAALQVDTFQGQIKLLKSALSELKITIGNQLLPVLTDYATKLSTIINRTSDWANENPRLSSTLTKVGATAGVAALALSGIGLAAPGIIAVGKIIKPLATDIALLGGAATGSAISVTSLGATLGVLGLALADLGLIWWAYKRIQKAATEEIDHAAIRTKVLTTQQEDLQLALEQVGGALNVYEQTGDRTTATLDDLGINAEKLNRAFGLNLTQASNASRIYETLERNFGKTSTQLAKLSGTFEKLEKAGPPLENAADRTKRLAEEMAALETEVRNLSGALLAFPSAMKTRTTEIQREADAQVAIIKQQTQWERDWFTDESGIIRLGMVQKNVDARLEIEEKGSKEERNLRDAGMKEAVAVADTGAKEVIKIRTDLADDSRKIVDDSNRLMGTVTKQQIASGEAVGAAMEKERTESLDKAKQAMLQWRNDWGGVIGEVEAGMSDLFVSIIDPSLKPAWKQFWNSLKTTAIRALADIATTYIFDILPMLLPSPRNVIGGKSTAQALTEPIKRIGELAPDVPKAIAGETTNLSTNTPLEKISGKASIGALATAALPIATGVLFGIFEANIEKRRQEDAETLTQIEKVMKRQDVSFAEASLIVREKGRELTEEELEASKARGARRPPTRFRGIERRERPGIDPERIIELLGDRVSPGRLQELIEESERKTAAFAARVDPIRRTPIDTTGRTPIPGTEPQRFIPRRPETTDRFGRPIDDEDEDDEVAAAPARMAPARDDMRELNNEVSLFGRNIRDLSDTFADTNRAMNEADLSTEAIIIPGRRRRGISQIPGFAKGGIIDRPTLAVVGENAPRQREAIIPLEGGAVPVEFGDLTGIIADAIKGVSGGANIPEVLAGPGIRESSREIITNNVLRESVAAKHISVAPIEITGIGGLITGVENLGTDIGLLASTIRSLDMPEFDMSMSRESLPDFSLPERRFDTPTAPATTTAQAPGRGDVIFSGDINVTLDLSNVTDIRELDSAELERLAREGIVPALEALGIQMVRNDNLMVS